MNKRPIQHGKIRGYERGCRCDLCREAKSRYTKKHYDAKAIENHGTVTSFRYGCRCQECQAAQSKASRQYHDKNRKDRNAYSLARRNSNPQRWRDNFSKWFENNREYASEQCRIRARDYYWNNRDQVIEKSKLRHAEHPERRAASRLKRRKANGSASAEQIAARLAYYGGVCAFCGDTFKEIEHSIPIARGGTNWPANLRPSCEACNDVKGTKTFTEFMQHIKQNGVPRLNKLRAEVRSCLADNCLTDREITSRRKLKRQRMKKLLP